MNFNTSRAIAVLVFIVVFCIHFIFLFLLNLTWGHIFIYATFIAIIVCIGVYVIIEKAINEKIKNIYKIILHTKSGKREELFIQNVLPKKNIKQTEQDVKEWSAKESVELEFYNRLSKFKKEFLQNLSHELITPLFSIQAYSENLILHLQQSKATQQSIDFVMIIIRNTDRLNNLIKDVDTITKLESLEFGVNKNYFVLEELIDEVLQELYFFIKEKKININATYLKEKNKVFADKEKIKQVLINVIDNAIKYNPPDTNIDFMVQQIDDNNILLEISDNGIGISHEHTERVFERFYRINTDRSREHGGSGLGLAICKHIMELHNSFIHLRSKPNVGSTLTIGLQKQSF